MVFKIDTRGLHRFVILLYKGLLLRKRHYIVTGFEFLFPVIVASIPAIIMSEANIPSSDSHQDRKWINDSIYVPFDPFTPTSYAGYKFVFAYAPSNNYTDKLMKDSIDLWKKHSGKTDIMNKSLENAHNLEIFCVKELRDNRGQTVIGTYFDNIPSGKDRLPDGLEYTIRYSGDYSNFHTNLKYRFSNDYIYNEYTSTYFLSWQASVERTFIKLKSLENGIKPLNYEVSMKQFPFPGHKDSNSSFSMVFLIPLLILSGFIVFIINLMRRVVEEKSNGSKELLKMMGMSNCTYWSSTFTNFFIVGALVMLIVTIVYKVPLKNSIIVLPNSDFFLLYVIFLLFMASMVLFCLALTTFFNKAVFGVIMLIIAYNVSYSLLTTFIFIPGGKREISYFPLSLIAKLSICLLPSGGLLTAFEIVAPFETSGEGIQWSNIYSFDAVPDMNLSRVMLAMIFSCLLYALLIWYIDAVWPWQYGIPKPFYFPFTKTYWCGYNEKQMDEILMNGDDFKNHEFFEDEPIGVSPGVVINNLYKVFKTGLQTKVAVNNVSLNIYNGQITALLGHNGAGKTTTINILTGLYTPSGGSASINGWNIFSQTTKARESLGVCPQHNVLFDTLTVEEHLKIYAVLKGVSYSQLNNEALSVMNMLQLVDKKSELTKNLSGGMKRKLSLGIAVIGGSKVLFLDEPTSGMDVEARRAVWDALLEMRYNRTIVLTTHYMEEADILGDRIAIMSEGEIQCCGSPLFLKRKFGTGYHLHLVKNDGFDINAMNDLVVKYVPGAAIENDYEREITFSLMSRAHSSFAPFFEEVENKKEILGVSSFGITVTTMEDVFLNVTNISDMKMKTQDLENTDEMELKDIYMESRGMGKSPNLKDQFYGLFVKRFHYAKRYWSIFISQLILPFILMCVCLYIVKSSTIQNSTTYDSLKLDIKEIYGITDSFVMADNNDQSVLFRNNLENVLKSKEVHTKRMNNHDNPDKYILNYASGSFIDYCKKFIVGGSVEIHNGMLNFTAWFNGLPYHASPLSLLLMDSAILRYVDEKGYITLTNNPLPYVSQYYYEDQNHGTEKSIANVFAPLALSFLSASFILVPIQERASKAKLLQLMTGISAALYWLSMFIWDFIIHVFVCLLLIIPFSIFSHYVFFTPHSEAIGAAVLLMIMYGWSTIPFSYLFSLIFKKPNTGFSVISGICIITGVVLCSIFSAILLAPGMDENKKVKFFSWLFRFFPAYALSSGFGNLFSVAYANAVCESLSPEYLKYSCDPDNQKSYNPVLKCCKDICGDKCMNETNPFTFDKKGVSSDILFLFFDGILYFLLLLMFESSFMSSVCRYISQNLPRLRRTVGYQLHENSFIEDSDVLQEEERVRNDYMQLLHEEALIVLNLSKHFKGLKAVDHLTFGIHKEECFGLLGVNGAGKTTTFRMLVGDCYPTEGNAYIDNFSVITHLKEFQSQIGYCPQFDALIDRLSAREMIMLFARLRGLSGSNLDRTVNSLIKMTDLHQYADKPSMVYSGGNKRKLSIALALIGSPPLLLLDEPTAGVDPVSRRKIWKILSLSRAYTGAAVILTTHSMEESEALCSRLAIMVNGRFQCLGSIQQLKSKFGQGYTIIIKMKKEDSSFESKNAVKAHMNTNLPGVQLKNDYQDMLQYHVIDPSVTLSFLFKFMDDMKKNWNLEDYIISDTSLEQIFLAFARSQRVSADNC